MFNLRQRDFICSATVLHTKEPKHIVERAYRKEKIAADKVIEVFRDLEDEIKDSLKKTLSKIEKNQHKLPNILRVGR